MVLHLPLLNFRSSLSTLSHSLRRPLGVAALSLCVLTAPPKLLAICKLESGLCHILQVTGQDVKLDRSCTDPGSAALISGILLEVLLQAEQLCGEGFLDIPSLTFQRQVLQFLISATSGSFRL